jgi:hypothetical protein
MIKINISNDLKESGFKDLGTNTRLGYKRVKVQHNGWTSSNLEPIRVAPVPVKVLGDSNSYLNKHLPYKPQLKIVEEEEHLRIPLLVGSLNLALAETGMEARPQRYNPYGNREAEGAFQKIHAARSRRTHIVIIGCGGTGGYLIRDLARYINALPYSHYIDIMLIDSDKVEAKNIGRQNFMPQDIGKSKAEVLARRYSLVLGMPITSHCANVTAENFGQLCMTNTIAEEQDAGNYIIISCVDSNKARLDILRSLGFYLPNEKFSALDHDLIDCRNYLHTLTWIDAGNESHNGQVVCSHVATPTSSVSKGDHIFSLSKDAYFRGDDYHASMRTTVAKLEPLMKLLLSTESGVFENTARQAQCLKIMFSLASMPSLNILTPPAPYIFKAMHLPPKEEVKVSCAEHTIDDPQTMIANIQASIGIMYYISRLLPKKIADSFLDHYMISWNGASVTTTPITETSLNHVTYWAKDGIPCQQKTQEKAKEVLSSSLPF